MKKKNVFAKAILLVLMVGTISTGCSEKEIDNNKKRIKDTDIENELISDIIENNENDNEDKDSKKYSDKNTEEVTNSLVLEERKVNNSEFDISYVAGDCIVFEYDSKYGVMDSNQNIIQEPELTHYSLMTGDTLCCSDESGNVYIFNSNAKKTIVECPDESECMGYTIFDDGNVLITYLSVLDGDKSNSLLSKNYEMIYRIYNNEGKQIKEIKNNGWEKKNERCWIESLNSYISRRDSHYFDSDMWGYVTFNKKTEYTKNYQKKTTIHATLTLFDSEGNIVSNYENEKGLLKIIEAENSEYEICSNISNGLLMIKNTKGKYGYINYDGDIVIETKYEKLGKPQNGYISFFEYGKWGFLDYKGNVVIEAKYDDVGYFNQGVVPILNDNVISYIDNYEKVIYSKTISSKSVLSRLNMEEVSFHDSGYAILTYDVGNVKEISDTSVIIDNKGNELYHFCNLLLESDFTTEWNYNGLNRNFGCSERYGVSKNIAKGTYWDGELKNILMVSITRSKENGRTYYNIEPLICKIKK